MTKSLYDYCIERNKTELLSQWVEDKNGELTPHNVSYGSQKKIWWRCEQGHEWQAAVCSRTGISTGCPYCKGNKLDPAVGTLEAKYPELAKQWHPTKNVDVTPSQIFPFTHRPFWWLCEEGHEWLASANSRAKGCGCPVCNHRKILIGVNDLATTHPELATQWHPTKNEPLTPEMVFSGSTKNLVAV